ncbi:MAG TPA: hypothetical protein GXZ90_11040 [Clostridiales bacterium]|nr:hypothetical protein [Clostridiales bacterium]
MKINQGRIKLKSINIRAIISLIVILSILSIVIVLILIEVSNKQKANENYDNKTPNEQSLTENDNKINTTAIVKEIDFELFEIILYDFINKKEIKLNYSGSSDIKNKFNQVISITQIPTGKAVDIEYDNNYYINSLQISKKAWEYAGVKNLTINKTARIMNIASINYKYTDELIIKDGDNFVSVDTLAEQDVLTVWGYEENIWSIIVEKGHGSVRLTDSENFIDGMVTIGFESPCSITDETIVISREGNYNITVENGQYSVTKHITIKRNQETIMSLAGIGPEAIKTSQVKINVYPENADLIIDGQSMFYDELIELEYGTYDIEINKTGYQSYFGKIDINTSSKTLNVNLPEISKPQEPEIEINDNDFNEDIDLEEIFDGEFPIDEDHYIYIQNPIAAAVYLNGEYMIDSPGRFPKIIGKHVLTFIKSNYQIKSYTINVEDDGLDKYISMPDLEIDSN